MIYKCIGLKNCEWTNTCPWAYGVSSDCLDYIKQREEDMIIELFYARAWTNDLNVTPQIAEDNLCPRSHNSVITIMRR